MRYGSPWSAGWGSPYKHLIVEFDATAIARDGMSYVVLITPRTGYGDALFGIYVNGTFAQNVWIDEGESKRVRIPALSGQTAATIYVFRLGHFISNTYRCDNIALIDDTASSRRATLIWDWQPVLVGALTSTGVAEDKLTSWSFSGLQLDSFDFVAGWPLYRTLSYACTVDGSDIDIEVTARGVIVASGSGTLGASVTLTGSVSGSVSVAADCTTHTGTLHYHYPRSMRIKRGTSNPPTAVVATVAFNERDTCSYTEPSDLSAGTYYYRIQPISSEGDIGDDGAVSTVVIVAPPSAPANLRYTSGDMSSTRVSWNSVTGATYNVYVEQPGDGYLSIYASTSNTYQDITFTANGIARVVVRAVVGGVEEQNNTALRLEYASGAYVPPRPNTPYIASGYTTVESGRTISVQAMYEPTDERGTATTVKLFARTPSGSYNFASADDTATLTTLQNGLKSAALDYTAPSNGHFYLCVCAATADGTLSAQSAEVLVYADDTNLTAPTLTARATRG